MPHGITWPKVDQVLWCHMAALGHNELTPNLMSLWASEDNFSGIEPPRGSSQQAYLASSSQPHILPLLANRGSLSINVSKMWSAHKFGRIWHIKIIISPEKDMKLDPRSQEGHPCWSCWWNGAKLVPGHLQWHDWQMLIWYTAQNHRSSPRVVSSPNSWKHC